MKRNLIIIFILICQVAANAQQIIDHYTFQTALISDKVRCLAEDDNGNIWIGTVAGLTKYDGDDFISYTTSNGLAGNVVYDIHVTASGIIYVATSGGLSKFDGTTWTSQNVGSGLPENELWCVTEGIDGKIWVGTANMGAAYYNGSHWTQLSVPQGLAAVNVKSILADRNGNIWFGTASGVSMYNGTSFRNFNTTNGLPGNLINQIIQLKNGNIALATNNGIAFYNYYNWSSLTTASGLPATTILSILEDKEQNLWFSSVNGLTKKIAANSYSTYNYSNGLADNTITKILLSKKQNNKIWCATNAKGVSVFDNNQNVINYRENLTLVNNTVNVIYVDNENVTWIGTNGGLNRVQNHNWKTFKVADGLTNNNIRAIHKDNAGNLWVGTSNGLNKINGTTIRKYTLANGLTNTVVNSITSGNLDTIFVATNEKIFIISADTIAGSLSTENGLLNNKINEIHFENNKLWILADEHIQIKEQSTYSDLTSNNCTETFTRAKAKGLYNTQLYFGTNKNLRKYVGGVASPCISHPYTDVGISSITKINNIIYCTFENGLIQSYNETTSTWVPQYPSITNAKFIAESKDNNYLWIGTEIGIQKLCLSCNSQSITINTTSPVCYANNGSVNITGVAGANSYSIDNGATWQATSSFANQRGGYKHFLAKNTAGAIIVDSVFYLDYYNEISDAKLSITPILCHGNANGSITLTYAGTTSFIWETAGITQAIRTNLSAGTYTVTVRDANACQRILSNTLIEPTALNLNADHNQITCNGSNDGSISLNVSGGILPYSYTWSSGQNTANISNLSANTYNYTVRDANNCNISNAITINNPQLLQIQDTIINISCNGVCDASIQLTIRGGTPTYTISWNQAAGFQPNNLCHGTYIVTVKDHNNCSVSKTYTINNPSALTVSGEHVQNIRCYGDNSGSIEHTITGGTGDLTYQWKKEGNPQVISTNLNLDNLNVGVYNLTVTDENLCTITRSYTLTQSPELEVEIEVTPIACTGSSNGSLRAIARGGSGMYSGYYWYNSQNQVIGVSDRMLNLAEGNYYVVVRDSYSCYDTARASLGAAVVYNYNIINSNITCNGLTNGSIRVEIDGGATPTSNFTFNWQNNVAPINSAVANNLPAGEYAVTIIDPQNCEIILNTTVTQPPMQDIGVLNDIEYLCYGSTLSLDAGDFTNYLWSTGERTRRITVNNAETYTVKVVDSNGCNLSDTVRVIVTRVYNNEKINLATVTNDGKIKLIWNKTPNKGTAKYNIYKDEGNGFNNVATKYFNDIAIYEDANVNTQTNSYQYKITAVDSCGAESLLSEMHKTCLLNVNSTLNGACYLDWSEYKGFFVVYYYILKGSTRQNLQVVDSVLYNDFNYVEMNPHATGTYYQIKVRRIDGANPGDGNYYTDAYSNIVFCDNITGTINTNINQLDVYPNPFNDQINIKFNLNIPELVKYKLINMLGQEILSDSKLYSDVGEQYINLNLNLDKGIYILKINVNNEQYNLKLIKE